MTLPKRSPSSSISSALTMKWTPSLTRAAIVPGDTCVPRTKVFAPPAAFACDAAIPIDSAMLPPAALERRNNGLPFQSVMTYIIRSGVATVCPFLDSTRSMMKTSLLSRLDRS